METLFPVVFFDGDREINLGNVVVHPSLDYKSLQSIFSRKIGIAPNQFSVFLADRKTSRKMPITAKANFSAISREKNCLFLVVARSSRSRRQKRLPEQPVADVVLLKRVIDKNNFIPQDLEKRKDYVTETARGPGQAANGGVFACEGCARDKQVGGVVGFHHCVNDAVVTGFRMKTGPIARPVKKKP